MRIILDNILNITTVLIGNVFFYESFYSEKNFSFDEKMFVFFAETFFFFIIVVVG